MDVLSRVLQLIDGTQMGPDRPRSMYPFLRVPCSKCNIAKKQNALPQTQTHAWHDRTPRRGARAPSTHDPGAGPPSPPRTAAQASWWSRDYPLAQTLWETVGRLAIRVCVHGRRVGNGRDNDDEDDELDGARRRRARGGAQPAEGSRPPPRACAARRARVASRKAPRSALVVCISVI